jgi:hypothetical protein
MENYMKNLMITTALFATVSTAAIAEDFKANQYVTTFTSGSLEFSLGAVETDLTTVTTTAVGVATYSFGAVDTSLDLSFGYDLDEDAVTTAATLNASTAPTPLLTVYGSAELAYVADTGALSDGEVFVSPTVGTAYAVSDSAAVFAEVGYAWNASDNWVADGGEVEVGVDFAASEAFTISPSLVRTFDTTDNATNFKVEATLRF